jgi:acyl-coenzyme A synthetase/AMP-(fatty) acid ligase
MVITREIINKNIIFHDIVIKSNGTVEQFDYTYIEIYRAIDLYKKQLLEHGVKPQETVTYAGNNNIWQTAFIFATFELGLQYAITDYFSDAILNRINSIQYTPDIKTKLLLTIHYTISSNSKGLDIKKTKYACKIAEINIIQSFDCSNLNEDIDACDTPYSIDENFIATKSATSGTIGNVKCAKHSHNFLYSLLKRNSKYFSGNFIQSCWNMNHGNSIFCYFIPALSSEKVTNFYNIISQKDENDIEQLYAVKNLLNTISDEEIHILTPYPKITNIFLTLLENTKLPNLIVHVLSYITKEWVNEYYKTGVIGDIVSNFGSNETTGPIFINRASYKNFSENTYKLLDNFFAVEVKNKETKVFMPVYNKFIALNDIFEYEKDTQMFLYKGRPKLLRINDLQIDPDVYNHVIEKYFDSKLIFDKIKSKIYLAIWDHNLDLNEKIIAQRIEDINNIILELSGEMHYINKYDVLQFKKYLNGEEYNEEKLLEYFRDL